MSPENAKRGRVLGSSHDGASDFVGSERCETIACLVEAMAWSAEDDEVYGRVVEAVASRFGCSEAFLYRSVASGGFVCTAYYPGGDPSGSVKRTFSVNSGRISWMMRITRPVFSEYDHPRREDAQAFQLIEYGYRSSVTIPLIAQGQVVGVLCVTYKRPNPFDERDEHYLLSIGRILGVFLDRVQKTEKRAELLVLNERKQLASEIHDSISQYASTISIAADTAQSAYAAGEDEACARGIKMIGGAARELNQAVRNELLQLKMPLEERNGLVKSVEQNLERINAQWGLETRLECDEAAAHIPLNIELQLVRIVNECISNVVKHANASRIKVSVDVLEDGVDVCVADDGCGFEESGVGDDRLGIKIMRERALAIGGVVNIASDASGTSVSIFVPFV